MTDDATPRFLGDETAALTEWCADALRSDAKRFEAAKTVATRLGGHWTGDHAEFGLWTPELLDEGVSSDDVYLELLLPPAGFDPTVEEATVAFERYRLPTRREDEFTWAAVEGVEPGYRDRVGPLYWLAYEGEDGIEHVQDPVAYSVPFGAFGPAELYDVDRLDRERADREWFQSFPDVYPEDDGVPRVEPATSMLEVHPGTATEAGSLAGLAEWYDDIGAAQREGEDLTAAQENWVGYDAVQLMPLEPLTENEDAPPYWAVEGENGADETARGDGPDAPVDGDATVTGETVDVQVRQPDQMNWGYDIVVGGFSAPNPAILETGRPDELVDLIATLHNLPTPIKVVFDVALGHADNGGLDCLNDYFFEGPGMYGQELDYSQPVVRAILLEMQRRKMDFGADGVRVDGAQDFTVYDEEAEELYHDDEFLAEMDAIVQEVGGQEYRPWMIFEDGRPWPREDWELASTYRELIDQHPHSFQWSPITFAHNTPALLTFWATKWWRVKEVAEMGSQWITGVANHDTIRRGTQIDTTVQFNQKQVNPFLGDTLRETLRNAYDNQASSLWMHAFMPGVPMDFTHGNNRAPWGFIRNTDALYNVKVVAEEAHVVNWQVTQEDLDGEYFERVSELGFDDVDDLWDFMRGLEAAVSITDYQTDRELAEVVQMVQPVYPLDEELTTERLHAFAQAWMEDMYEFANLSNHRDRQDPERTAFERSVREFRQERPWLREDLGRSDYFTYQHPANGTVLYYGLRESPDGDEQILFAGNMEGNPREVVPADLEVPQLPQDGWEVALTAPGVDLESAHDSVTLEDSDAVVLTRRP